MTMSHRHALILALVAGLPFAPVAQGASTMDTPTAVVEAFHAALAAGDRATSLALLSPEVVIFESGGAELSRDEYAHHHLGGDMEFSAATTTEVLERRSGGDDTLAWVLTRSATTGSFRGSAIDAQGVETMILERGEQGWKIVHIHWSSRSARPRPAGAGER